MKGWRCGAALSALLLALGGCTNQSQQEIAANLDAAQKIRQELQSGAAAVETEQPAAPERTGWATLTGQFKIDGPAPPPKQLTVNSDRGICAPGGKPVLSDALLVDEATQGIANVVVYARKVDDNNVHESMQPGANTEQVVFDQKNCLFQTRLLAVQLSQPVLMTNSDNTGHNTNIPEFSFNVTIAANGSTPYRFGKETALPVSASCNIHPWMLAYVLPRENGYFAVTKPDGTFEIKNLPAGVPVEFQVWHEVTGNVSTVSLDGQPKQWKSGRFLATLDPDETRQLAVTIPSSAFQR